MSSMMSHAAMALAFIRACLAISPMGQWSPGLSVEPCSNTTCLSYPRMLSTPCSVLVGVFLFVFFPVGDGMKGQAQFQTDTVQIPGTYLCDLW